MKVKLVPPPARESKSKLRTRQQHPSTKPCFPGFVKMIDPLLSKTTATGRFPSITSIRLERRQLIHI
jgi:hypothetical protein